VELLDISPYIKVPEKKQNDTQKFNEGGSLMKHMNKHVSNT